MRRHRAAVLTSLAFSLNSIAHADTQLVLGELHINQPHFEPLRLTNRELVEKARFYKLAESEASQLDNETEMSPGIGLRLNMKKSWFVFGEANLLQADHISLENSFLYLEQPKSILVGGGIYF